MFTLPVVLAKGIAGLFKGGDSNDVKHASYTDLIGDTPMIEIQSLSDATGCKILAKCEYLNPGGSVKDRIARAIIEDGEQSGLLTKDKIVVEATQGSTGIALAKVCCSKGYQLMLFLPAGIVSKEKIDLLMSLGVILEEVPIVPMSDPDNYMHLAHKLCLSDPDKYFYSDQFNNTANFQAHYTGTGPEIWNQTNGTVDGFILSGGTGGTLAGCSRYLKDQNTNICTAIVDPPGSGLYNLITHGTMYDFQDTMLVQPLEPRSIYEGIGMNRQTDNLLLASIDCAFLGSDLEGVEMAYYLMKNEGLYVGGTSALNLVGAVKLAKKLGPGKTIVTIICDDGSRYKSKLYNRTWLEESNLLPTAEGLEFIAEDF